MKFTFAPESRPLEGYTIKRAIERGGFGEVYYALSDAGKEVALKLLQHNLEVELRGVRQCLNLKHANLMSIFDIRTDADGDHWIVMEYVSGPTLEQVLRKQNGPLPDHDVKKWMQGVCTGLSFLHDRGIVHRDLKPANIYMEDDVVKIGDVGLSKFISGSNRSAQTQSVGTVYYMAPEVGRGRYGKEVDVYAVGVMLYELLTGDVPFDGESTAEILMKHLSENPDLSKLPEEYRPVVAGALEKDPLKRTATIDQFLADFNAAAAGEAVATAIPEHAFVEADPIYLDDSVFAPRKGGRVQAMGEEALRRRNRDRREAVRRSRKQYARAVKHARKADRHARKAGRYAGEVGMQVQTQRVTLDSEDAGWSDSVHTWIRLGAVAVVLMAIFLPRLMGGALRYVLFAGLAAGGVYAAYRLINFLTRESIDSGRNMEGRQRQQQAVGRNTPRDYSYGRTLTLREHSTELTGSLTFAAIATAVVTSVLAFLTSLLPDLAQVAHFGLTVLLASWAILTVTKFWEGPERETGVRRLTMLGVGVLVGLFAWWLDGLLLVDMGMDGRPTAIFSSVGSHSLVDATFEPSAAGYAVFFGGLFALLRWWSQTDPFRRRRFGLFAVMLTLLLGYVVSAIWTFPHMLALMLAAAISSVVHLSAAWVPPQTAR